MWYRICCIDDGNEIGITQITSVNDDYYNVNGYDMYPLNTTIHRSSKIRRQIWFVYTLTITHSPRQVGRKFSWEPCEVIETEQ